jgi:hypothetical protein
MLRTSQQWHVDDAAHAQRALARFATLVVFKRETPARRASAFLPPYGPDFRFSA